MAASPSKQKDIELDDQEQYIAAKGLRKGKAPMNFKDIDAGNKPVKAQRPSPRNDTFDHLNAIESQQREDAIAYARKLEGTMNKGNEPDPVRGRRSFGRRSRFNSTNSAGIQQEQAGNATVTVTRDAEQVNTVVGPTQQACTTQDVVDLHDDDDDKFKGVLVTNVNEELKWFFKARDGQTMGPCSLSMLNLLKTHDPVASEFKVWSIGHNEDTSLPLSFVVGSFYKGDEM